MLKKTLAKAKNIFSGIKVIDSPAYRIADIIQDDKGEYKAIIQIVGKKDFFKIKPGNII